MNQLFESSYSDEARLRDGGFIFQAILSYDLSWAIVDGETVFDQKDVFARLHRVDAFPDLRFQEGYATLTYVILSEVNLLKRKIDLATEEIKKRINPDYAAAFAAVAGGTPIEEIPATTPDQAALPPGPERDALPAGPEVLGLPPGPKGLPEGPKGLPPGQKMLPAGQKALPPGKVEESAELPQLTSAQMKELNERYFKGTRYKVRFTTKDTVLREVSTSGLNSGRPNVTLKLSTGMVNTLDGKEINSWDGFSVAVSGGLTNNFIIDNSESDPISKIIVYDPIENVNEQIFKVILPSVLLEFSGDSVQIDTYSNRSTQVAIRSSINFDNLFEPEANVTPDIEEPEEGEKPEEETENKSNDSRINN